MAEEKKLPKWVETGNPADANPPEENPESQQEEPQEEVEVIPPLVSEAQMQENERQHVPWTPDGISVEEHQKQIEEARAKPVPLSEGNLPPDREIVTPTPTASDPRLDPQHEQAMRLQEIWSQAQALNPSGMPISGVQVTDASAEVTMEGGIETTTIHLGQDYFAGPDHVEQPHGVASPSSERPKIPCPHCDGTGEVPFGWVQAHANGPGSAA